MAALLSATAEKSCFCLGFKYELLVSRFEFGESRKDQKNIWPSIAVFWTPNPKSTTIHHHGAVYGMGISKQAGEDGASTIISLASMCAA
jgi:hypothetical protein